MCLHLDLLQLSTCVHQWFSDRLTSGIACPCKKIILHRVMREGGDHLHMSVLLKLMEESICNHYIMCHRYDTPCKALAPSLDCNRKGDMARI